MLCIFSTGCLGYGVVKMDGAALQLGFLGFVVLAVSYLVCYLNFRRVEADIVLPGSAFAGEKMKLALSVSNEKKYLSAYAVEVELEALGNGRFFSALDPIYRSRTTDPVDFPEIAREGDETATRLTSIHRRGVYSQFKCWLTSSFPFGLFRCSRFRILEQRIAIFPNPVLFPELTHVSGDGLSEEQECFRYGREASGEFRGLREFTHGDSLRYVHWPLSAKFDQLLVKEYDPATPERFVVAFHSYCPKGKLAIRKAEPALRVLAGVLIELQETGASFELLASFNDWRSINVEEDPVALDQALYSLAEAKIRPTTRLKPLLEHLSELDPSNHRLIVVSDVPMRLWRKYFRFVDDAVLADGSLTSEMITAGVLQ